MEKTIFNKFQQNKMYSVLGTCNVNCRLEKQLGKNQYIDWIQVWGDARQTCKSGDIFILIQQTVSLPVGKALGP